MAAAAVPYETLDSREIMRRWPAFRLGEDIHGLFQEQGGIAKAGKANAAHQRLARAHGATLLDRVHVGEVHPGSGEIGIELNGVQIRCRQLIITAGAWSNRILSSFGLQLPLTVTQEQVTYFSSPRPELFQPDRFPVWIWMDDPCFYGFPTFGEAGPKVGQDAGGKEVTAETRTFDPDAAALGRVTDFLARHIPDALGPIIYTKTCLYTLTPDRDFIIDRLPSHPGASIAIGGGHGFKFASLIGKILADLATVGRSPHDLTAFRIDREILQLENPPKHYMV
jgi:sarcosine oxidase